MTQSIFKDLWNKMFYSGSRLYLFIGINVLVFLLLSFLKLEYLFTKSTSLSSWLQSQLSVPSNPAEMLIRPWTVFTYMFTHVEIFHFLFNMLVLYWFGRIFEDFLNARQFTFAYLAGGLFGGLLFIVFYNIFPGYAGEKYNSELLGASGSVMAIVFATATLVPDYSIRMLFFGDVRIKYLALIYLVFDIIGLSGLNAGGSIAHLGGALLGFVFIRQLQQGGDWSKLFQQRKKLKVVKNTGAKYVKKTVKVSEQEVIDEILDKISHSGYDSLTKEEKEQLFKASNKE